MACTAPNGIGASWVTRGTEPGTLGLTARSNFGTLGIVGRQTNTPPVLDSDIRQALGLALDEPFRFVGRRPSFVQWAAKPVAGLRLAIGDAAFHHDPIGGRGLAFALGSAFAAAAVLLTWRDDQAAAETARAYYENYVASEARRHLAFLDGDLALPPAPTELPERLRWIAPATAGALVQNDHVVAGEAFTLVSGQMVRWAGGFDLARLRELTMETLPSERLAERLREEGLIAADARSALVWALAQGLVGPAKPTESERLSTE
jgi:hypothetical protein